MEDDASMARVQDTDSADGAWPVDIQAAELPPWARVGQEPPYGRATVSADGAVTFRPETAAQC
jgi:hypothetical protein